MPLRCDRQGDERLVIGVGGAGYFVDRDPLLLGHARRGNDVDVRKQGPQKPAIADAVNGPVF